MAQLSAVDTWSDIKPNTSPLSRSKHQIHILVVTTIENRRKWQNDVLSEVTVFVTTPQTQNLYWAWASICNGAHSS